MEFKQIHFLNLFSFPEIDKNASYNNFIQDPVNRYQLIGNHEYLFNVKTHFLNPKNLLNNKPIYRDMKLGHNNNVFLITEYYKTNLENISNQSMSLPTGIKINDYFELFT